MVPPIVNAPVVMDVPQKEGIRGKLKGIVALGEVGEFLAGFIPVSFNLRGANLVAGLYCVGLIF